MPQKLIFVNGNVVTLDASTPRASAVVMSRDEILYVGDDETPRSFRERDTNVLDLRAN